MSDYRTAVNLTLIHEGSFQNDPDDHANWSSGQIGVGTLVGTKYGITAVDMPGVDIANITQEQAVQYYAEHYWKSGYSQIEAQSVADKLFDLGVLFGVETAVRQMQIVLAPYFHIDTDGIWGAHTLDAINQSDEPSLLEGYKAQMVRHTFEIATAKPEERKYLAGWGRRINCADPACTINHD